MSRLVYIHNMRRASRTGIPASVRAEIHRAGLKAAACHAGYRSVPVIDGVIVVIRWMAKKIGVGVAVLERGWCDHNTARPIAGGSMAVIVNTRVGARLLDRLLCRRGSRDDSGKDRRRAAK